MQDKIMRELYLDNAATTQVKKEVVKEMEKYYLEDYGNPGSLHKLGERALEEVNKARVKLSREINAKPGEIYFTSGGTESDNWALIGLAKENPKRKTIVVSSIEHPAIMESCEYLSNNGFKIIKSGFSS